MINSRQHESGKIGVAQLKPKFTINTDMETQVSTVEIQDETFTLLEPLIQCLQQDRRLAFVGYKNPHCLRSQTFIKMKPVSIKEEGHHLNAYEVKDQNERMKLILTEALQDITHRLETLRQTLDVPELMDL